MGGGAWAGQAGEAGERDAGCEGKGTLRTAAAP